MAFYFSKTNSIIKAPLLNNNDTNNQVQEQSLTESTSRSPSESLVGQTSKRDKISSQVQKQVSTRKPEHLTKGNVFAKLKKHTVGLKLDQKQIGGFEFSRTDPVVRGLFKGKLDAESAGKVLDRIRRHAVNGTDGERAGCLKLYLDVESHLKKYAWRNDPTHIRDHFMNMATDLIGRNERGQIYSGLSSQYTDHDIKFMLHVAPKTQKSLEKIFEKGRVDKIYRNCYCDIKTSYNDALSRHLAEEYKKYESQGRLIGRHLRTEENFEKLCGSLHEKESGKNLINWVATLTQKLRAGGEEAPEAAKRLNRLIACGAGTFVHRFVEAELQKLLAGYDPRKADRPLREVLPRPLLMIEFERRIALGKKSETELLSMIEARGADRDLRAAKELLERVRSRQVIDHSKSELDFNPARKKTLSGKNPFARMLSKNGLFIIPDKKVWKHELNPGDPAIRGLFNGKLVAGSVDKILDRVSDSMQHGELSEAIGARKVFAEMLSLCDQNGRFPDPVARYYNEWMEDLIEEGKNKKGKIDLKKYNVSDEDLWMMLRCARDKIEELRNTFDEYKVQELEKCSLEDMYARNRGEIDRITRKHLTCDQLRMQLAHEGRNPPGRDPIDDRRFDVHMDRLDWEGSFERTVDWLRVITRRLHSGDYVLETAALRQLERLKSAGTNVVVRSYAEYLVNGTLSSPSRKEGGGSLKSVVPREMLEVELERRSEIGTESVKDLLQRVEKHFGKGGVAYVKEVQDDLERRKERLNRKLETIVSEKTLEKDKTGLQNEKSLTQQVEYSHSSERKIEEDLLGIDFG